MKIVPTFLDNRTKHYIFTKYIPEQFDSSDPSLQSSFPSHANSLGMHLFSEEHSKSVEKQRGDVGIFSVVGVVVILNRVWLTSLLDVVDLSATCYYQSLRILLFNYQYCLVVSYCKMLHLFHHYSHSHYHISTTMEYICYHRRITMTSNEISWSLLAGYLSRLNELEALHFLF